jgi:hypothetical protein
MAKCRFFSGPLWFTSMGLALAGCVGVASKYASPVRPTITTQPSNQAVSTGQTATFAVVAAGTAPLSYQWRKNGVNIPAATSASYTSPAAVASDNGATFDVMVSNMAGSMTSTAATLTVNSSTGITITTQPVSQSVTIGQTATFSVAATSATLPLTYQWQKNGANIASANSPSYTTPATTILDGGEKFTVVVTNATGNVTSSAATLTVNPSPAVDVTTYHNDSGRTGQNTNEIVLTHTNVNSTTFGKVGFFAVDGLVDAQPLYLSNVAIPGKGTHDALYVVTEKDNVYAFDATTGDVLWHVTTLLAGETFSDERNCTQVTPNIGITSTPVIDRTRGPHGAIYLVAMSKDSSGNYHQRLHALDVTTGAELLGGPTTIQATSRHRPEQHRGECGFRSGPIQGARRASVVERSDLYRMGLALRQQSV